MLCFFFNLIKSKLVVYSDAKPELTTTFLKTNYLCEFASPFQSTFHLEIACHVTSHHITSLSKKSPIIQKFIILLLFIGELPKDIKGQTYFKICFLVSQTSHVLFVFHATLFLKKIF